MSMTIISLEQLARDIKERAQLIQSLLPELDEHLRALLQLQRQFEKQLKRPNPESKAPRKARSNGGRPVSPR
jgi:hypothetical protein